MRQLSVVAALPARDGAGAAAVGHPATQSGFIVTEDSAYAEHVGRRVRLHRPGNGYLAWRLFDTLRAESYRASESAALIEKAGELWDWRKSTYSEGNGGQCVEVASATTRSWSGTPRPAGRALSVTADAWQRFTASLRKPSW